MAPETVSVLVVDDQAPFRIAARAVVRRADGGGKTIEPGLLDFLETLRAERSYATKFLIRDTRDLYFVRAEDVEWQQGGVGGEREWSRCSR